MSKRAVLCVAALVAACHDPDPDTVDSPFTEKITNTPGLLESVSVFVVFTVDVNWLLPESVAELTDEAWLVPSPKRAEEPDSVTEWLSPPWLPMVD
jgi:hypothetical protein